MGPISIAFHFCYNYVTELREAYLMRGNQHVTHKLLFPFVLKHVGGDYE